MTKVDYFIVIADKLFFEFSSVTLAPVNCFSSRHRVFTFENREDLKVCINCLHRFRDREFVIEHLLDRILLKLGVEGNRPFVAELTMA